MVSRCQVGQARGQIQARELGSEGISKGEDGGGH